MPYPWSAGEILTADDLNTMGSTTTATLDGTNTSAGGVRVFRNPIGSGDYMVTVSGTVTNGKGSNWAGSDLIFTIPAGYRGAPGFVSFTNITSNTVGRFNVDIDGTADYAGGTVANTNVVVFSFSYIGTA